MLKGRHGIRWMLWGWAVIAVTLAFSAWAIVQLGHFGDRPVIAIEEPRT